MKFSWLLTLIVPLALVAAPAGAQDYWEYSPWEDQWEHHQPTQGLETEYENGYFDNDYAETDVEQEQYEWEPGEGYHEQEWYDPSDWFEVGSDMDYEYDDDLFDDYDYDGGYYDDGFFDDDWYYDYYR